MRLIILVLLALGAYSSYLPAVTSYEYIMQSNLTRQPSESTLSLQFTAFNTTFTFTLVPSDTPDTTIELHTKTGIIRKSIAEFGVSVYSGTVTANGSSYWARITVHDLFAGYFLYFDG
jgi:hypothetical protein